MMDTSLYGLTAALALMTAIWFASLVRRDVSIIDIFWGPGFAFVAWIYFSLGDQATLRQVLLPCLVTLWGLRLGLYIFWRGRNKGEDYRYAEMRQRWGIRFPFVSLGTVFWLQAVLLWLIAMPLLTVQRAPHSNQLGWLDGVGAALFAIGFFFEAVGDFQLARFKDNPANKGKVLDTGLWRYTRHPNYFGDAALWWGFWLISIAGGSSLWTVVSPILMNALLLKVSGVALLEKTIAERRPAYREYVESTPAFFPRPPKPGAVARRDSEGS